MKATHNTINTIAKSSMVAMLALTTAMSAYAGNGFFDDDYNDSDNYFDQCENLADKIDDLKDGKQEMKEAKSDAVFDAMFSDDEDDLKDADASFIAGDIMTDVINDELKSAKRKYRKLGCHHWD